MHVTNGRLLQVGKNEGRSLGFVGLNGETMIPSCDPTNDVSCLENLQSVDTTVASSSFLPGAYTMPGGRAPVLNAGAGSGISTTVIIVAALGMAVLMMARSK